MASVNKCNGSSNVQERVLDFLESEPYEWMPTNLEKRLGIKGGTLRSALFRLKQKGKVINRKVGKNSLYSATKRHSEDFIKLFKKHQIDDKYLIHGLTLKLIGDFKSHCNRYSLGGSEVSFDGRWKVEYQGRRVSFQLSDRTLMCWVGCSDLPFDYEGFVYFLYFLDGCLLTKGLPSVLDHLFDWKVVQYGLNKDGVTYRNDSPTECVSVQSFVGFLARCYNKKSLGITREEVHGNDEMSLEKFVSLFSDRLSQVELMNFFDIMSLQFHSFNKRLSEIEKFIRFRKNIS